MRSKLTYSNVMATMALFVALGGSSYAAVKITGKDVVDRSLTAKDVKKNTLSGTEINESKLGKVKAAASADNATNAANATNATNAANAANASNAAKAALADKATTADKATNADSATNASHATNADHASTADSATSASKLGDKQASDFASSKLEDVHMVGTAGEPAFQNSFASDSSNPVGFYKDPWGIVHLTGATTHSGAADGLEIFTLPAGYRPAHQYADFAIAGTVGQLATIDIGSNGDVVFFKAASSGTYGSLEGITFRAG